MKYYVIGQYDDGLNSILDSYDTLKLAQGAINWQGQPRGKINWHDKARTRGETWYSGGRDHSVTQWVICHPTNLLGVFAPIDGGDVIRTTRGPWTPEAFEREAARALQDYVAG